MIKPIKGVKEYFRNKKIYVWNVNRDSMKLLIYLMVQLVDVKGFVITEKHLYENNFILNRPIMHISQLESCEDAVLVVWDDAVSFRNVVAPLNVECVRYSEMLTLNGDLAKKKVYIYGTGYGADSLRSILKDHGIPIEGYYVSECPKENMHAECPVTKYESDLTKNNDAIIVSVIRNDFQMEILRVLSDSSCDVYVNEIVALDAISDGNFIEILDKTLKEKRKIYLCGSSKLYNELLRNICQIYGIPMAGLLSEKNIYYLADEDNQSNTVIVGEPDTSKLWDIMEILSELGYTNEQQNITSLQECMRCREYLRKENFFYFDGIAGSSIKYGKEEFTGWKIFGKHKENCLRIVILGGSTSTEGYFYVESWMKKLWKKLKKSNIRCNVYIGAYPGNGILDEFLRFLRDGHLISPNIVISMSGINDMFNFNINRFNFRGTCTKLRKMGKDENFCSGMKTDEDGYDFWVRNEKNLKLYVENIGAKFYAFLQPVNACMDYMTIEEKMRFEMEERIDEAKNFMKKENNEDLYVNFLRLFHHKTEMFMDSCHYSEMGGDALSDEVLKVILPYCESVIER